MNKYFLVFITLLLLGCITPQPIPDGYNGPTASLLDTYEVISKHKAQYFEAVLVDGRPLETSSDSAGRASSYSFNLVNTMNLREVPAATSTILIRGITIGSAPIISLLGNHASVEGYVTITLEPNGRYIINGVLSESFSGVWVETNDGLIVSDVLVPSNTSKEAAQAFKDEKNSTYHRLRTADLAAQQKRQELFEVGLAGYHEGRCELSTPEQSSAFEIAKVLFEEKHYEKALACFNLALTNPPIVPETYKFLFLIYDIGLGVNPSPKEAQKWNTLYQQRKSE